MLLHIISNCILIARTKLLLCIKRALNKDVLFTSRDKIIDYSIFGKDKINNVYLSNEVMNVIEKRKEVIIDDITLYNEIRTSCIISPLIVKGDLYGSLIIYSDELVNEKDKSIISYVKLFLENYLE